MNYNDGILVTTRHSATMIARTLINGVANNSRMELFKENSDVLDGVQFVATLDGKTSFICASLDGTIWKPSEMDKVRRPPLHPNCRSTLIPYIEIRDENGNIIETSNRPAANADFDAEAKKAYDLKAREKGWNRRWEDLAPSTRDKYYYDAQKAYTKRTGKPPYRQESGVTNFREYFEKQPESFKKSWLGETRYRLYSEGKLKLDSLVKADTGYVVSVDELKTKYGTQDNPAPKPPEPTTPKALKEAEQRAKEAERRTKEAEAARKAEETARKEAEERAKTAENSQKTDHKQGQKVYKNEKIGYNRDKDSEETAVSSIEKGNESLKADFRDITKDTGHSSKPEKKKEEEANQTLDIDLTKIPVSKEELEKMIANREPILEPCDDRPMTAFYAPEAIKQRRKAIQKINKQKKEEIAEAAKRLGISKGKFIERCEAKIKKELENAGLYRRIRHNDLLDVMDSGRFKSQFETHRSGGRLDPSMRSSVEFSMFGYEDDVDENKAERPIYGYIDYKDKPIGKSTKGTRRYGDCIVQFKEDVKKRTTFCSSDSLGPGEDKEVACSSMLNPNITTIHFNVDKYLDSAERLIVPEGEELKHSYCDMYTEAQFHGGLTVDDIECVFIKQEEIDDYNIGDRDIERLIEKGLIVEIIK